MQAVMLSIRPEWCALIISGKKTIEIRKTKPKIKTPFKCYIYCTANKNGAKDLLETHGTDGKIRKANGKVIGEFVCDCIMSHCEMANADIAEQQGCIKREQLFEYAKGKELYGWHISDLKIYDKPKKLSEFKKIKRDCWYADLGLAKRDCSECQNKECFVQRPFQSWGYVEERAS